MNHESAQDGSSHGCQAKGQRACAVAVVSGAAVLAGLNGEEGDTLLGAAGGTATGGARDCPVQLDHDFRAGVSGGGAASGVIGRVAGTVSWVRAVAVENAARVAGEGVQSSKTAGQNNQGGESIHVCL